MRWQQVNPVRLASDAGYFIEALGAPGSRVYVVWPPVEPGDRVFKWPHRVIASFGDDSDKEKVNQAKQFCEQHCIQGNKDAA